MQAVILAAGKSTRTYPLTITRPKPLLKVANKTLLEHNLDNLKGVVDEVIIVVGYKKKQIKKYFGNKYENIMLRYVEQKQQLGTGHALLIVEKYIKNEFISLHGDDIYSKEDFRNITKNKYSILVGETENPSSFGVIIERHGFLADLVEKPKKFISNLTNTGLYKFDKRIFSIIKELEKSERGEYELTDAIKFLSKEKKIHCIRSKWWLPIAYPWDLLKADKILRKNKSLIGKNTKIYSKITNSTVGNNCIIKGNIRNSLIMDNSVIDENSAVEDSVIGEDVYFKGKIFSKNKAFSFVKNEKINSGRFGAVIGDNSKLVNVTLNAGCKISPYSKIKNKTIQHDV